MAGKHAGRVGMVSKVVRGQNQVVINGLNAVRVAYQIVRV
jgi:ribosomal protein L24